MEKSTKRAWKLSSMLITLVIAMGLLSTRVFLTSSAADQLDQYQTVHEDKWHDIHGNKGWSQSFEAGLNGNLTKVVLYLKKDGTPEPLVIELRNSGTGGETYDVPGNTILASVESSNVTSTTGQEYSFTFPTAVSIGTSYTIVLYQKNNGGGKHDKYRWSENTEEEYRYGAGNNSKGDHEDTTTWKRGGDGHDQYFETYVDGTLDQQQTNSSENKWHDIHGNKGWSQSFEAGLNGNLKVTLYLKSEGAPQPLVIELRNSGTGGETYDVPGNTILASVESSNVTSTTGQEYSFTFPTAVSIGTSYTIVLYQKNNGGGKHNKYYWSENQDNQYTTGNNSKGDHEDTTTWKRGGGGHDQYFETYVAVPSPSALTVTNSSGASNVTTTSTRLNGEVTSTGGENPTVHIYWGDNDGGTSAGNWDHDENLGTKGAGTFYKDISNLTPNTAYYYRCYANSGGSDWANSSASFTTSTTAIGSISVNANPINVLADGKTSSTITATVKDQSDNNVPDGTNVIFTTDHGTLGSSTVTKQTSGGVATATLTSESSTETVIATIIATANVASGTTTVFFIPEGGTEVEEAVSKDVSGTGGTISSRESPTGGEVTVSGSSIPEGTILTVAKYTSNPEGTPTFKATEDYWDSHLNNDTGVTNVTMNFSPADPGDTIYYWDGASWHPCSDQTYSDGSVVVTITDSTSPNLSDLSGLVLAKGGLDTTPPTASITFPSADTSVGGEVVIKGTASDENFKEYKVEYGQGTEPSSWTEITSSTSQVTDETLATWDTTALNDGSYTLRLTAQDLAGNSAQTKVSLRVDNHPPKTTLIDYPNDTVTGNTPKVAVDFTWTGSDPGGITPVEKLVYQYKLEGHLDYQDWSDWTQETTKTYILSSGNYTFKVRAKDEAGNYPDENESATAKSSFTVSLPIIIYPNPCYLNQGQIVTIANLPLTSDVKIYIYDLGGSLIRTLGESEANIEGGSKTATWDCRNDNGEVVTRDIYIYFILSATEKKTGKIAIIR